MLDAFYMMNNEILLQLFFALMCFIFCDIFWWLDLIKVLNEFSIAAQSIKMLELSHKMQAGFVLQAITLSETADDGGQAAARTR